MKKTDISYDKCPFCINTLVLETCRLHFDCPERFLSEYFVQKLYFAAFTFGNISDGRFYLQLVYKFPNVVRKLCIVASSQVSDP